MQARPGPEDEFRLIIAPPSPFCINHAYNVWPLISYMRFLKVE